MVHARLYPRGGSGPMGGADGMARAVPYRPVALSSDGLQAAPYCIPARSGGTSHRIGWTLVPAIGRSVGYGSFPISGIAKASIYRSRLLRYRANAKGHATPYRWARAFGRPETLVPSIYNGKPETRIGPFGQRNDRSARQAMARTIQHHVDPDAIAAIPPSIRNSGVAMKCLSGYGAHWIST